MLTLYNTKGPFPPFYSCWTTAWYRKITSNQETTKDIFGLRVKLPPVTIRLTTEK